jgi:hypothetical protein
MVWSDRTSTQQRSYEPSGAAGHRGYQRRSSFSRESPAALESQSRAAQRQNSNMICIVDPYSRKLEVPRNYLHETHALHRVGIPSLCMLYLDGRCRAGTMCHQAHVDLEVIEFLRKEALSMPTCCREHGDLHSGHVPTLIGDRTIWLYGRAIEPWNFASTLGLQRLIREATSREVELLPRYICRLHLGNKCRYVEECNHVHLCRDLKDLVIPPELSFTNSPTLMTNSSAEFSHEASTPPEAATPPASEAPSLSTPTFLQHSRWSHAPYTWKVLDEYDYISEREQEALKSLRQC